MDYQMLALDLDGTLTNSKKEITKPTLEALIDIQKAGKKVVLASGRPTRGVLPLAEQLQLKTYGSYILSFNGGRITDCRTGDTIYNKTLPTWCFEPVYQIVSEYKHTGIDIVAYPPDKLLSGFQPNKYTELESFINHTTIDCVGEKFLEHIPHNSNKILITGDPNLLQPIQKRLREHFRSTLNIYCSDPFFLEIMPPGIDKAHSLIRLLTSIGLTTEQMICCGDGYNDISMIETAGLGVAMANAQPAVLEKADYVTRSNDEDGVLHVINQFMR